MARFITLCMLIAGILSACSPTASSPGEITLVDSIVIHVRGLEPDQMWKVNPYDQGISILSPAGDVFYTFDLKGHLLDSFAYTGLPKSRFNYFLTDSSLATIDKNRNIITVYHQDGAKKYAEPDRSFAFYNVYFPLQIFPDNEVFLYRIPNLNISDTAQRVAYFSHPVLASCVLQDSNIVVTRQFGGFPEAYRDQDYNESYPQAAVVSSSQLAYIYSIEPVLYLYDKQQDTHREINIPISPNIRRPYDLDISSYTALRKYELENEKYHKLLYDAVRHKFILFRGHIIEAEDHPFEMKVWADKSFTMYVVSMDGTVEAQTLVSSLRGYFIPTFFAGDGHIYLGKVKEGKVVYEVWKY